MGAFETVCSGNRCFAVHLHVYQVKEGNMITVRNLVQQYRAHNPEGRFFDRDILNQWGEAIGRMKVNGKGVILTREGDNRICWELQAVQCFPVLGCRVKKYYFDESDYSVVVPGNDDTATAWEGVNDGLL
jgi:hypothetical protein